MNDHRLEAILELLGRLEGANICCSLAHNQEDAISVMVVVPGARWEIDFYLNGRTDVEIFRSDGTIHDLGKVEELFRDGPLAESADEVD